MVKIKLKITGMHCPSCEMLITDILEDEGVKVLTISAKSEVLEIEFDETKIKLDKITEILAEDKYTIKEI
jgi:copper chaperone CopZ